MVTMVTKELAKYAKENYPGFEKFSTEDLERFFDLYKNTTLIRFDRAGKINGFCVFEPEVKKKTLKFIALQLDGDRKENFRLIRDFARHKWPGFKLIFR